MRLINKGLLSYGVLFTFSFQASISFAVSDEDVIRLHEGPQTIGIATGHDLPLNLAPAVATSITAEELDSIGATTLSQALALVPGVNALNRRQGDHFIFRGIRSDSNFNPDWLLMVDGVPQNDLLFGNQQQFIGDVPIQSIARIEVIRGPGSALYGANAFAGVVNVITKKPKDVTGSEVRLRGGSWHTEEGRYLQRDDILGWSSLLALQLKATDGPRPYMEKDAQTFWDNRLATHVSLAPAQAETWERDYSLSWDLEKGPWRASFRHRDRAFADGLGGALDPGAWFTPTMNSLDWIYNQPRFSQDWDLKWNLGWYGYDSESHNTRVYPPGAFGGTFPDGLRDEVGYSEQRTYTELSGLFHGYSGHAVLVGGGGSHNRVYDVRDHRNYNLTASGTPVPIGQMVETSANDAFAPSGSRTVGFVYGQDEWNFEPDWILTSGVRYDHYSDFGSSTNPRLALVWSTTADLTTKFLAGRAFRAPTLFDLDGRNNVSVIGNPNLKPEVIRSYEVSFDYRPRPQFRTGINFFDHDIANKIHAVKGTLTTTNQNIGPQYGRGGEWEWTWKITDSVTFNGWYAHQYNIVKDTGADTGFAPHDSANIRLDWRVVSNWFLNIEEGWVAHRKRPADDVRSQTTPDYLLTNITLRYKPLHSAWSESLSVFNIFNKRAEDPGNPPGKDRVDNLLPGRNIYIEIRYYPSW